MTSSSGQRPVRPRTRRRQLQQWGVRHAPALEELNEALAAMVRSAEALAADAGGGPKDGAERAAEDAERFLAVLGKVHRLPPVPHDPAQASWVRALVLWQDAATAHLASLRPYRAEDSAVAAEKVAEAVDEFLGFAASYVAAFAEKTVA